MNSGHHNDKNSYTCIWCLKQILRASFSGPYFKKYEMEPAIPITGGDKASEYGLG
jgi:hypothetical protein